MRGFVIVGVILIILGALALAYQGIWYTDREKVIDVGPIEATAEQEKRFPLPPIVGGALIVGGIVMVFAGMRRSRPST
ncbi:MAG TPA: hypothetical protein VN428_18720 [Bryobacteraceae bacterium]|nr:hypothetical protein [Bryobacteraceae bacterium]